MRQVALGALILVLVAARGGSNAAPIPTPTAAGGAAGIHKIQHVVVIMQENRSFDHYFGLYPGADRRLMKLSPAPVPGV